jgi:2-polyprenyl-6-hydroxyphenyl methylase/3-demethylubiquinone-9 3-methyltransferase
MRSAHGETVYEQAVPSYTHANPLMAWLFWQRLRVVMRYLERIELGSVLDFGCGSGVLLPFLADRTSSVLAADLVSGPSEFLLRQLDRRAIPVITSPGFLSTLGDRSLDTIIALDVLEHVDDLERTVREFARALAPGGRVVVSGPTESAAYRMGRRLAGFTKHSHVRNIFQIEAAFMREFRVRDIRLRYLPLPFFRIFAAEWTS